MPSSLARAVLRWGLGVTVGTTLVALTSPLFVRSYLPTPVDGVRNVWTLQPGSTYRWRSEGYANTTIGPLGMPGARSMDAAPESSLARFALWGDSQAEGISVPDHAKIFAIVERLTAPKVTAAKVNAATGNPVRVYPFARSGDDVRDWLAQMPSVESHLKLAGHIMLVVDLADLAVASGPAKTNNRGEFEQSITKLLPAFVIHGIRNLAFEQDGSQPRSLRFGMGPVVPTTNVLAAMDDDHAADPTVTNDVWPQVFATIRNRTSLPIIVLYAPPVPIIMQGKIRVEDGNDTMLPEIQESAHQFNIRWVDLRDRLAQSSLAGKWPRGFHNGQFGVGHLNEIGNEIVARSLIGVVNQLELEN